MHSAIEIESVCDTATYKTVTLSDFVYEHNCFPGGWEGFFLERDDVRNEIAEISPILANDAEGNQIEPPMPDIFNAFQNIGLADVKVVILGQDPTPQPNQATGMAFSLKPGVDPSTVPSVHNMLVELKLEGVDVDLTNGDLTPWRDQGVLLLNAALTVIQGGKTGVHQRLWAEFTKLLIQYINKESPPSAWILWGRQAQKFAKLIKTNKHYIKAGNHPSPRSQTNEARFFGGNYFRCANEFLGTKANRGVIDWGLPFVDPSPAAMLKLYLGVRSPTGQLGMAFSRQGGPQYCSKCAQHAGGVEIGRNDVDLTNGDLKNLS
ncbi:hypothetical protein ACROYT_G044476 [Oculina patagonica]